MQLEPSKLHQSSGKKFIINMEQAVSRLGEQGTRSMQLLTSHSQDLQRGAAPSHSWLLTVVSPITPVTPRGTAVRVSLATHSPQGFPKGARIGSVVVGERQAEKG